MVGGDLAYIRRLIADNVIKGPVLELGVGYGGGTSRSVIEAAGLRYYGTDLSGGEGVDYQADFERPEDMVVFQPIVPVGSILILNVLEHTFDPIRVLDNAASLLRTGGALVVSTPAVWPLHNYPMDAWRMLPNFYEEYANRRGFKLLEKYFDYVGFGPVTDYRNPDATYSFPPPAKPGVRYWLSRAIHWTFNTFGRSMFQPSHIAVGAVFLVERNS
jgi:SAM-dependent methyltransferase